MTAKPLTPEQLAEIAARAEAATPGPWCTDSWEIYQGTEYQPGLSMWIGETCRGNTSPEQDRADATFVAAARTDIPALLAEIHRLRNELAEEKASHDPRLRCLLVKATPDRDLYVGWSNTCEMPAGTWSRETAIEYGFPPSRLDRADQTGSSSHIGDGAWDDKGFVAEQRGWLRRDRLGDYAVEYLHGDREAAYALLEPFEDDTTTEATR